MCCSSATCTASAPSGGFAKRNVYVTHLDFAYRWFCRLGLDGCVPDHSTFPKNRHGRFRAGDVHRLLFEEVARACTKAGLTPGWDTAISASPVEADAGRERKFAGAAPANTWDKQERQARPVREHLAALAYTCPEGHQLRHRDYERRTPRIDAADHPAPAELARDSLMAPMRLADVC